VPSRTTIGLLFGLAGAGALFAYTRTKSGSQVANDATASVLDFVDVSASRVSGLLNSRGYRNNNPGNLRFIVRNPWNGQVGDDGGYGIYDTPANGTRALGKQLLAYARAGRTTVRDIIATWAPTNENDTESYIRDVASQLGVEPDVTIDVDLQLGSLARAIAKHENGYLDAAYNFDAWVRL
jgi:hypothetical protein